MVSSLSKVRAPQCEVPLLVPEVELQVDFGTRGKTLASLLEHVLQLKFLFRQRDADPKNAQGVRKCQGPWIGVWDISRR